MSRITIRMPALVERGGSWAGPGKKAVSYPSPGPISEAPATKRIRRDVTPKESPASSLTEADMAELSEAFAELEMTKDDWSKSH